MFSMLRTGTPLYMFDRGIGGPRLDIAEVVSVSQPKPMYDATFQSGMWTPPKSVVDIQAKIGEQIVNLEKLPAEASIADFGNSGMVVSESRDCILTDINGYRNTHAKILEEVDMHKEAVERCDAIIAELNPQIKKEAEQAQEIKDLRAQLDEMKAMLSKALKPSKKEES